MIKKFLKWLKDWNGLLTREGGYISKPELHAFGIGSGYFVLAFLLPTPIGEMTAVSYLFFLKVVLEKAKSPEEPHGHLQDVAHEYTYIIWGAAFTVVLLTLFSSYSLTTVDFGSLLTQILIGG